MACSKKGSVIRLAAAERPLVIGEVGMVMVKYLGWVDEIYYIGSVTGAQYTFGLIRQQAYVDSRDLPGFLEVTEDTKKAFELVP